MNYFIERKTYRLLFFVMLALNILLIILLWQNSYCRHTDNRQIPPYDMPLEVKVNKIADYMNKELNFTEKQMTAYKQLTTENMKKMEKIDKEFRKHKDLLAEKIFQTDVDTNENTRILGILEKLSRDREYELFRHFNELKELFTAEQNIKFKEILVNKVYNPVNPGHRKIYPKPLE